MAIRRTVGIDFGTSTTLIAESAPAGRPSVVPIGHSTSWMPSLAAVLDGDLRVAEDALEVNPGRLITSVKSCITNRQEYVKSSDGTVTQAADEVILALLAELATRARSDRLPISQDGVSRLGCPAMWDADQRLRLLMLAEKAGFRIGPATLIDEPIAAGLHWIGQQSDRREFLDQDRVLVFDMGGGTLDVALLDVTTGPGRDPEIYVLASAGVSEAGDTLDQAIANDFEGRLNAKGIYLEDLPDEALARAYVVRAALDAKLALSDARETDVHFGYTAVALPKLRYTVEELEQAFRPQLDAAWNLILSTLRAAYLTRKGGAIPRELRRMPEDELTGRVTHVLLAGGMSRVPGVAKFLGRNLPKAKFHEFPNKGGQEAIVAGLAENTSYEQVNLHRPAFDFKLEYRAAGGELTSVLLYRAHTPFYEWWEALSRDRLTYQWPGGSTAVDPGAYRLLPTTGYASLAVVAMDGSRVALRHQGKDYDSLKVAFGKSPLTFTLSPEGRMSLRDGRGTVHSLRIARWPALGSGFAPLALPVESPVWEPMRRPWWDTK